MWYIEEFGEDDYLVTTYDLPGMDDDDLRSLIQIRNTEDWIRGVGHPIEAHELSRFLNYLATPIKPNEKHAYFAANREE